MFFFFFNDTATTEIYTLSLHDALPISGADERGLLFGVGHLLRTMHLTPGRIGVSENFSVADRKSTRLNSSHDQISYAVFCLKKKTSFRGHAGMPLRPRHAERRDRYDPD